MELFAPLIWVEADRKPAKYLLNSLKIHTELFPLTRKIIITNQIYFNLYKNLNIDLVPIEKFQKNIYVKMFESTDKVWTTTKKQLTYWKNTTKRFIYLYSYLYDSKLSKCVHLESDCVLIDSRLINHLTTKQKSLIYFPKQSNGVGCASILIVNGASALEKFIKYINKNWKRVDITDMELLGRFANEQKYSEFMPAFVDKFREIEFVSDPVSVARYFLGNDARNFRLPFSKRGVEDKSVGSMDLRYFKIVQSNTSSQLFLENLITKSQKLLINVHIHSKRIPRNYNILTKMLLNESNKSRNIIWRLGRIDSRVMFERIISKLKRIFLPNKDSQVLFR